MQCAFSIVFVRYVSVHCVHCGYLQEQFMNRLFLLNFSQQIEHDSDSAIAFARSGEEFMVRITNSSNYVF